jgi:hypothetical protein
LTIRDNEGKEFEIEVSNIESIEPMMERNQKYIKILKINFCKRIKGKNSIIITHYYNPNLDIIVAQLLRKMNCIRNEYYM